MHQFIGATDHTVGDLAHGGIVARHAYRIMESASISGEARSRKGSGSRALLTYIVHEKVVRMKTYRYYGGEREFFSALSFQKKGGLSTLSRS
ncbi:hypothetical protein [Caballeronia hypogeia]|uniref:hypothetical protein n=1 Tax=Caballeronia hypogeia TaxID=1777140 RepID=UPI000772A2C5|nr:hypothetical protein [Caballeronia hypogeia]